jgi:hypothetical protein
VIDAMGISVFSGSVELKLQIGQLGPTKNTACTMVQDQHLRDDFSCIC